MYLPVDDSRVFEKYVSESKKVIPQLRLNDSARKQAEIDVANKEMNLLKKSTIIMN